MFKNYTEEKLNNLKMFLELEGYIVEKEYERTTLYKKQYANSIMVPNTVNLSDIDSVLSYVYDKIVDNYILDNDSYTNHSNFLLSWLDIVVDNLDKLDSYDNINKDVLKLAFTLYDGNYIVIPLEDIVQNDKERVELIDSKNNIIIVNKKLKDIVVRDYKSSIANVTNNILEDVSKTNDIKILLSSFIIRHKLFSISINKSV